MKWNQLSIVIVFAALSGCSGSSNSPKGNKPDNNAQNLPNWTLSNYTAAPTYTDRFVWSATLTNTGNSEAVAPRNGFLIESISPDFATGFRYRNQDVIYENPNSSLDPISTRLIAPGESIQITSKDRQSPVSRASLNYEFTWTPTYVKFWINPDIGKTHFQSLTVPQTSYGSVYSHSELNYLDNQTNASYVEKVPRIDEPCTETDSEENDTLNSAQSVTIGVTFPVSLCLDSVDVFDALMEASSNYLIQPENMGRGNTTKLLVVSPSGEYRLRTNDLINNIEVTTTEAGLHKIIVTNYSNWRFAGALTIDRIP